MQAFWTSTAVILSVKMITTEVFPHQGEEANTHRWVAAMGTVALQAGMLSQWKSMTIDRYSGFWDGDGGSIHSPPLRNTEP